MLQVRNVTGTLLLLLALLGSVVRGGQLARPSATADPTGQLLTLDRIDLLAKQAGDSSQLDDETKKKVAEIYRSARAELQHAAELATRAELFKTDVQTVAQRVAQTKQQLDQPRASALSLPAEATLAELEQALSKFELELAAVRKAQAAAEAEPASRAERRKEIRRRLETVPDRQAELQKQIQSLPAAEPAPIATARSVELAARRLEQQREVVALENELAKYDAEDAADLVRLQRDLHAQELAQAERRLQWLQEQTKKVQAKAAEQAVRKARNEAISADPVLKSHAERNRQLAEIGRSITEQFDAADKNLTRAKKVLGQLKRQFEQMCKKVESVGLTSSVGALLRKQRAALPDIRDRRATASRRRKTIDDLQYQLLDYDDERQQLANPEVLVHKIIAGAGSRQALDTALLESAAHEVLDRKREYLDSLLHNGNKCLDSLVELDATDQRIIALCQQYQQYIDERVLWVRSGDALTSELQFDESDAWLISGRRWGEVPAQLWSDLRANPVSYGLAVLVFVVLIVRGQRLRAQLRQIGEATRRPTCVHFGPTLRSLALTVAIAAPWPSLIGFIAWRLNVIANESPFAHAVGHGLCCLCAMWFPLELFRHVCRTGGLAEEHFGWPSSATRLLRRSVRWLMFLGLPMTFLTSTFFAADPTHGRDAVERCCFIVQAVILAVFLCRVLRPYGGALHEYVAYHQGGWVDRLKYVWYWLGVAAPILLAGLAFSGYYYTAHVLSWRLYATMCFVTSMVLVRALLQRLILLRRRKLSMQQARERAAGTQSGDQDTTVPPAGIVTELPKANLLAHSVQTQRLLATGMFAVCLIGFWLIWIEVLPALKMLDQWPLWTTTRRVLVVEHIGPAGARLIPDAVSQADPGPATRAVYQTTSITFSNVALAVLVAIITFMSARNVPGLLEMSILQRLPLDTSVRYAITTLVSYGIVLLGVIVAFSNVGLRWSQIQWLATALTFGLAFGLQEIFANFVAGLIILFERPVRVGDVVTVDDVTGIVSRIRIRATSITNWDRKEYVVPNKEFITGRLLNWTLSDKVNRIVISIGIAYGSDTERARALLLRVAREHPMTLSDPPSIATFEGFGDNSLNFTLRTFLPSMDNRLQVVHELHTAIDKAFRQAGIEIAFPQRDLHIRSIPEALAPALLNRPKHGSTHQEAA